MMFLGGKTMVCNRCVKQDVCRHKEQAEEAEEKIKHCYPYMEIDCRHRELATQAQIDKMKDCGWVE
jgi:hypothetical protein